MMMSDAPSRIMTKMLPSKLYAIVKFELVELDFFTVDECVRTAAYVHEHKVGAIGFFKTHEILITVFGQ